MLSEDEFVDAIRQMLIGEGVPADQVNETTVLMNLLPPASGADPPSTTSGAPAFNFMFLVSAIGRLFRAYGMAHLPRPDLHNGLTVGGLASLMARHQSN